LPSVPAVPPGVARFQEALAARDFAGQIREMPASTRTAREAAETIGCSVAQIAKSLVFKTQRTQRPILVIASGVNRVNELALVDFIGEPLEKADAAFVLEKTGFVIGSVPPLGHLNPLLTFLDEDLRQYANVWAAAGSPSAVCQFTPDDLQRLTNGRWVCVH
jgi:prolyl-tRNA editing enzyme YbaK/EbsC (Cys-tRNA(Pro) deacylase)